jgi:hypothetical protein
MDLGERLVAIDNVDGDGGLGYGYNGTLTWAQRWTTASSTTSTVNAPANPAAFYTAQVPGFLCEITDSVVFRNTLRDRRTPRRRPAASSTPRTTTCKSRRRWTPTPRSNRSPAPRPANVFGTLVMRPVTFLDPRPKNQALTSVAWAPNDAFFSGARYRGAFAPGNLWTTGWTAATAFGMLPNEPWTDLGGELNGTYGAPVFSGSGPLTPGSAFTFTLSNAKENSLCYLVAGVAKLNLPLASGLVVPNFDAAAGGLLRFRSTRTERDRP